MCSHLTVGPRSCNSVRVYRGIPDKEVDAGTVFFHPIPPVAFHGPVKDYEVSLAGTINKLPRWLDYNPQTQSLQGLAVSEERGDYTIAVTAVGHCRQEPSPSTHFHLHVLNGTHSLKARSLRRHGRRNQHAKSSQGCPAGETVTYSAIILQADVFSLSAGRRLLLVSTMGEYLHLDPFSLKLRSFRSPAELQLENSTLLAEDTGIGDSPDTHAAVEVYWPVGCGDFQMVPELVRVLRYSKDSGHLSHLLALHLTGWRVFTRGGGGSQHRRRERRQLINTPTPVMTPVAPTYVSATLPMNPSYSYMATAPMDIFRPQKTLDHSTSFYTYHFPSVTTRLKEDETTNPDLESSLTKPATCAESFIPALTPAVEVAAPSPTEGVSILTSPTEVPTLYTATRVPAVPETPRTLPRTLSILNLVPTSLSQQQISLGFTSTYFWQITSVSSVTPPIRIPVSSQSNTHFTRFSLPLNAVPANDIPNISPIVLRPIKPLIATIGLLFEFSIPADTFSDPEDGTADNLTMKIRPSDGSPSGPESWLTLDHKQRLLSGYPLDSDMLYSPQELLLIARDSGGLSAELPFTIELRHPLSEPCHTYTIRTMNSFHSFVKDRRKIELFLNKMAKYFNDTGSSHISVSTLQPGSTVVSWHNVTLCQEDKKAPSLCPKHKIQGLLSAMQTTEGDVEPSFAQAMLPEFRIRSVGNVTYGGMCLHGSDLEYPSPTGAIAHSDRYRWIPTLVIALLTVLGLFLSLVLMAAIFRSCKACECIIRSESISLWPSDRPSCSSCHLELDTLKPRKPPLFLQNIPPPPPQLCLNLSHPPQERLHRRPLTHTQRPYQRSTVPSQSPPRYQLPPPYVLKDQPPQRNSSQ
ncbi:DAG1 protein, partial [Atractosteus spatula]|nr:DAG1 protein [Atractosteus spatula]